VEIVYAPYTPYQWIVIAATGVAVLLLMTCFILPARRRRLFGEHMPLAWGILGCSLLMGMLLTLAAWNPIITHPASPSSPHLIVVIDVSKSIATAPDGWEAVLKELTGPLDEAISDLPEETRASGTASLVLAAERPNVFRERFQIEELVGTLQRITESDFPGGSESDLAAGLMVAERLLGTAAGQGVVVLATDGHQTTGDAFDAAQRLARSGVPIYVLPLEGWSSSVHLAALDLPRQTEVGQSTFLRGLLSNRSDKKEAVDLRIIRNAGYEDQDVSFAEESLDDMFGKIPLGMGWSRIRKELVFQKVGIHYVDVKLEVDSVKSVAQRRLFTHVSGPPRLLALGGDNRWVEGFSADDFEIDLGNVADLTTDTRFSDYDTIVIHSAFATQFQDGVLRSLAQAVEKKGTGLFFANGGHLELTDEDPTVLMSYKGTPIEPLLPVSVEPRPYTEEVPPLQIVILIDESGSMEEGNKIESAKAIAKHIVETMMRPIDRLDLILFTDEANHIVVDQTMTPNNKAETLARIDNIQASGETEPSQALGIIVSRQMVNCGLIFISDGEFDPIQERPECEGYAFDIGADQVDPNFPLAFAELIPVGSNFNLEGLTLSVFDPQPRDKFFESGTFTPVRPGFVNPTAAALTIPEGIRMDGSAVSYVKPEADLVALRPKLIDPVLAYMSTGNGMVGTITGELSNEWLADPTVREGVKEWIFHTIPYTARDRYAMDIADLGNAVELCIQIQLPGNDVPEIKDLFVEMAGAEQKTDLKLQPDAVEPGTFCGVLPLPADSAHRGYLKITENGPDALHRAQRLPLTLPAASSTVDLATEEDYSAGTNQSLLQQVVSVGGGAFLPTPGQPLLRPPLDTTASQAIWHWLLVTGLFFYLGAILLRRLNV
jgi:Mg-chelatase subunit ChlD